ncbi:MAG: hypothetical protein H7A01_05615 [Hahellaceae bacterium]|nr:hypothetical protein [Hahellaceae bacterium]MCP5212894.1 hypothetical protein [Hahellaceae bacterium]
MMRKLAIALSLVGAMGPGTAAALGLGEATVKSSLNQPLSAEIELVNIRDLEQNEILPGMASREEFSKASIERLFLLSDIRFDVVKNAEGRSVIRLSTKKPIREPYLNFLVEVIWPSGRLLREYALLIDPPVFSEDKAKPVRTPTVTSSVVQVPEVYGRDQAFSSTMVSELPPIEVNYDGETYGPTAGSDTLWAIALKVRPSTSLSPQQVMLAIQEANPDAFLDGNINRLKAGHVLRVPSAEEISQRSKAKAVRDVVEQNRALQEGRSVAKRTLDATPEPAAPRQKPATLETVGDELKVVVAQNEQSDKAKGSMGGNAAKGGGSSTELAVAMEKLDKANREGEELTSRVKDLEDQLQTLQRLLTLKDDQLAEMQRQAGKAEAAKEQADQIAKAEPSSPSKDADVAKAADAPATDVSLAETPKAAVKSAGETPAAAAVTDAEVVSETATDVAKVEKPVEKITPKQISKKEPEAPVEQEQSLVDSIINNPLYIGGLGAGAVLLILGLIALSRHNAQKEKAFHESLAYGGTADADDDDDSFSLGVDDDEDETPKSKDEAEDPIAEADVYIAYGRLDQAASVLESGISAEPSRTDLRLKLLEVYKQAGDEQSFFKQFREVQALDDEEVLAEAELLKGDMSDDAFDEEPEISIDDLEKDLLSGGFNKPKENEKDKAIDYDISDLGIKRPVEADKLEAEEEADDNFMLDQADTDLDLELDLDSEETLEDEFASLSLDETDELASESDESDDFSSLESDIDLEELDKSLDDDFADLDTSEESLAEEDLLELDDAESDDELDSLDEELDLDLSLDMEDTEALATENLAEAEDELSLDDSELALDEDELALDLDDDLAETVEQKAKSGSEEDEVSLDDLSLDDVSLDELDAELDSDLEAMDLELEEEIEHEAQAEAEALAKQDDAEELDGLVEELEEVARDLADEDDDALELDELESSLELASDDLNELELDESLEDELDLDSADMLAELDSDLADVAAEEDETEDEEDFDFLSGTDEAATKLDLARAYVDMGDTEGARDILEEVSLEGNDDQKEEAKKLLKGLD